MTARDPGRAPSIPELAVWLALAALCAAAVAPAYMNHDAAWYLYMVDRWRDGATLYRDVIDTNPPLIIWLSAPPVLLGRALHIGAPALFKIYVFALALWTIGSCLRIVRRSWPDRLFPIVTVVTFVCLPFVKQDFGQREHFALLLTLPYILMAASRASFSSGESWLVGVAAGVGFALKPHFVVAWVLVEAAAVASSSPKRLRSIPPIAVVLTFCAYAAAVLLFTPQYLGVAAQVREVYGGLNTPVSALLRLTDVQIWVAAAAAMALVRWRREDAPVILTFAAATGFLVAALLQLKGWSYHLYPARSLLALFFVLTGVVLLERAAELAAMMRGGRRGLAVVFALVAMAASARYVLEARHPLAPDLVGPLIAAIHERAPQGPIAVLSTAMFVYPAFPAVNYTHAAWALRQNSLLFVTGIYALERVPRGSIATLHAPSVMGRLEAGLFEELVEDLCRHPPRLLLVDALDLENRSARPTFDVLAYLRQDARLAGLLDGYRTDGRVGPLSVLTGGGDVACR